MNQRCHLAVAAFLATSVLFSGVMDSARAFAPAIPLRVLPVLGFIVSWISPVGPLKLSYAKPLNAKVGDRLERFQFQMGTGF